MNSRAILASAAALLIGLGCGREPATSPIHSDRPAELTSGPAANLGGLILYHGYDGNTLDRSRYHHDGIPLGGPSFTNECQGQALVLDGIDDGVYVANTQVLQPTTVTVEVRFKPAQTLTNGTVFEPIVVKLPPPYDFGTRVDGYDIAYQDPFGSGGRIGFGIGSQNGLVRVHASYHVTLGSDRFHYVVGTYDGAAIRLYLDGALVATQNYSQPIAYLGGPIQIGGNIQHSLIAPGPQFFQGQIDFVAIHDRALSAQEIAARTQWLAQNCG